MSQLIVVFAALSLCAWLYLYGARGGFWRADQRLPKTAADLPRWPQVTVVIPARNEAETIGRAIASLLAQDYPGELRVVVVDDGSTDGTAAEARRAAGGSERLHILTGRPLAPGWTGKLWAVDQGVRLAGERWPETEFLLLTDADIEHHPTKLRRLVVKAESEGRDLVSLMVRLHCRSIWERLLVPAFVFFFQKLYPFPWINDPRRPEAAAAGGCMLVRRRVLETAGGIAAIRGKLIDDCALAAHIKLQGSIWLGLSEESLSLRPYRRLGEFWAMVARTAFTQLRHSRRWLMATVCGMSLVYLAPPIAMVSGALAANPWAAMFGALSWAMMIGALWPTLSLYRMPALWAVALPLAALLYILMTIDSARLTWMGRGGLWKGRSFDGVSASR